MKPLLAAAGVALLGLAASGCIVTSVYPFYSDTTVVFDPGLLGRWLNDDGTTTYTFEKRGDNAYRVQSVERKSTGEVETTTLIVHLLQLGEAQFLDAYPAKQSDLAIGTHFLVRMNRRGRTMTIRALDVNAVDNVLAAGAILSHVYRFEDGTVRQKAGGPGFEETLVMEPTAQLQAFLQRHAAEIFEKDEATLTKTDY